MLFPSVILNAVKNLILHTDVALFMHPNVTHEKGATWVLKDEILHCVQNDKVGFGPVLL